MREACGAAVKMTQQCLAADSVCWDSLTRGDTAAFVRQAAICAELWNFGVCADLLEEGPGC